MITPSSFPWVNYKLFPTAGVGSTPTPIFGSDSFTCVLSSIFICNTSANDIFFYSYILRVDVGPTSFRFNHIINQNTTQDVLNITIINGIPICSSSPLILQSGDILYAYTNAFPNTFDSLVSYAELLES